MNPKFNPNTRFIRDPNSFQSVLILIHSDRSLGLNRINFVSDLKYFNLASLVKISNSNSSRTNLNFSESFRNFVPEPNIFIPI